MPDAQLIDNDTTGPDNRPSGQSPWTGSADTDENGKATVAFTVSMQPGNNYRTGASCLQDALSQATQQTADALNQNGGGWNEYSVPLVWSNMQTVWT